MTYKVINRFIDTLDNNTLYRIGEFYPKGNYKPTKKRISDLSKEHPKFKCVFIEKVEETKVIEE